MPAIIGITTDVIDPGQGRPLRLDCSMAYARCVAAAGATPVLLPPILAFVHEHLRLCDGVVFTGGDDPRTEGFGVATHAAAKPVHPDRQAYELALLDLLHRRRPAAPILGVCLGMQMMALQSGGRLDQHLPDTLPTAAAHRGTHEIVPVEGGTRGGRAATTFRSPVALSHGQVASNHHQAVADPGPLVVLARAPDQVIEAVADPRRRFCVGVQWHPERTPDPVLGQGLFAALVAAAGKRV
jgi:putative glutamine amidotransferase